MTGGQIINELGSLALEPPEKPAALLREERLKSLAQFLHNVREAQFQN